MENVDKKVKHGGKRPGAGRKPKRGATKTYPSRLVIEEVDKAIEKSGLTFSPLIEKLIKDFNEKISRMENLQVLKWGIFWDERRLCWCNIELLMQPTGNPLYRITYMSGTMSKKDGQFSIEPLPSSITKKFKNEHRFKSPEEALECFLKFYPNKKVFDF